jgi:ribosomal protein S18 acetylase RimI-like enzyme
MPIRFEVNPRPRPDSKSVLAVLEQAGTSFPNWSAERMHRAMEASSVVICAWDDEQLVGFARAISDFAWCAYLSQLAVLPKFQHQGIGRQLVAKLLEQLGDEVSLLVHSAEPATGFYETLGFQHYMNVYRFARKK